jgi:hypothetical protein
MKQNIYQIPKRLVARILTRSRQLPPQYHRQLCRIDMQPFPLELNQLLLLRGELRLLKLYSPTYHHSLIKKLLKNPEINKKLKFAKKSSWTELVS